MFKSKPFYVTTPIYYVNDKPHLGHAYTTTIADTIARYARLIHGKENVFFLTGTDEHGSKVAKSASLAGVSPQSYANQISSRYQATWSALNISNDEFFRTTNPKHKVLVQDYLQDLYSKDLIYKNVYKGLYCVGCEKFILSDETINGSCIYHPGLVLNEQEEENYFLRLKSLSQKVSEAIKNQEYLILPEERKNEILAKINQGIEDISISRSGVDWGIPVPWDPDHTVYVWVDALLNYYTATKIYSGREKFWPPTVQLMAKDILWFHALVWEGLLLACDLPLPQVVYAHGFFTIDRQKMSKSVGNVIDPQSLVDEYGVDGARYLILTSMIFGKDGDLSLEGFRIKYTADLVNGIGNLISRVAKLCEISKFTYSKESVIQTELSVEVADWMERYRPDEAIKIIWKRVAALDLLIDQDKPWKLDQQELLEKIQDYVVEILGIAFDLQIFLPETSEKIRSIFFQQTIKKPEALFPRKEKLGQ